MARYQAETIVQRYQADIQSSSDSSLPMQSWKSGAHQWTTRDDFTSEPGNRYIDFLIPGIMGMNLMGGGLWGIGFVLVDMRVRKLLKRLVATSPCGAYSFLGFRVSAPA